jgi:hypothetical protein
VGEGIGGAFVELGRGCKGIVKVRHRVVVFAWVVVGGLE